jgi:hypothetical protein
MTFDHPELVARLVADGERRIARQRDIIASCELSLGRDRMDNLMKAHS